MKTLLFITMIVFGSISHGSESDVCGTVKKIEVNSGRVNGISYNITLEDEALIPSVKLGRLASLIGVSMTNGISLCFYKQTSGSGKVIYKFRSASQN